MENLSFYTLCRRRLLAVFQLTAARFTVQIFSLPAVSTTITKKKENVSNVQAVWRLKTNEPYRLWFAALWLPEGLNKAPDVFDSLLWVTRSFHKQAMDIRIIKANPTDDESCDNMLPLSALSSLQTELCFFPHTRFPRFRKAPAHLKDWEMTYQFQKNWQNTQLITSTSIFAISFFSSNCLCSSNTFGFLRGILKMIECPFCVYIGHISSFSTCGLSWLNELWLYIIPQFVQTSMPD